MSVMAELRAATWPVHQRLEKSLDVKRRFTERMAYRDHLERMWGFCSAVEVRSGPGLFLPALPDHEVRRKVPDADCVRLLPRCAQIPAWSDPAEALGCLCVPEGATLGGRTLLPLVPAHLGLSAEHGAAFLASYGAELDSRRRAFLAACEA